MTRCASSISNFPPKGERAIASSPASGRGLRRGFATEQAGKWLDIPQTAGCNGNVSEVRL